MSLLDDFRVNIGDDGGIIPSGIFPVPSSGFPVGANTTPLTELRVDIGDDDGVIPSGTLIGGIPVHNLLSPQHGDTTPAAPAPNDIIIGGASWRVLPGGAEGEQLTIVGGSIAWAPDASGLTVAQVSGIAVEVTTSGIAQHAAIPDVHHARYTDAEASGVAVQVVTTGIAQHTAISGAHHPRYTDAEAIAASSGALDHHLRYTDAEASGVAVQVVITGIAQHAAISGAHHPRYTDQEADNVFASGIKGIVLQESGVELTSDATTTAVLPTLSTLLTTDISLIRPSGSIRIAATAAVNATAGVPVVFHIYIDGAFYRGTTINVTGAIDNASIVIPRVAMTGVNPHTIDLRWAKFSLPLATVRCLPVTFPDFYHASLSVQEIE